VAEGRRLFLTYPSQPERKSSILAPSRVTGEKTKTLLVPPMGAIALVGGTMLPVEESNKVYRRQQNEKVIF
jgi:hypothetical protein